MAKGEISSKEMTKQVMRKVLVDEIIAFNNARQYLGDYNSEAAAINRLAEFMSRLARLMVE